MLVVAWLVAAVGFQDVARGQEIRVHDAGSPVVDAEISLYLNGIESPVGTTNDEGRRRLRGGIAEGTPVDVYLNACVDGSIELILAPQTDPGPCIDELAAEGDRCGCRPIGPFIWGGGPVTVNLAPGALTYVAQRPRPPASQVIRPKIQVGAGAGFTSWWNLDKGCQQPGALACEVASERPTYQGVIELYPWDWAGFGFVGVLSENLDLFGAAGLLWVFNDGIVATDFRDPTGRLTDNREDSGLRVAGKGGFNWWFSEGRWGIRGEVSLMSGENPDIDARWGVAGKLLIPIGSLQAVQWLGSDF
jgi:hypothetical protein